MASANFAYIEDTWANLRDNPIFRRAMLPRGISWMVRSPIVRGLALTAIAIAIYYQILGALTVLWPIFALAILFWTLIGAVHRWFCWFELHTLSRTGTLADYLNSGLSRADLAIGVIFPAVLANRVSAIMVVSWFLLNESLARYQIFLGVLLILYAVDLFRAPSIFLPDAEDYLRHRNPLALFFVSFAVLVPITLWFILFYPILLGIAMIGVVPAGYEIFAAFALTYVIVRFPQGWWMKWRLKRFYRRWRSFDDLMEHYFETGQGR